MKRFKIRQLIGNRLEKPKLQVVNVVDIFTLCQYSLFSSLKFLFPLEELLIIGLYILCIPQQLPSLI